MAKINNTCYTHYGILFTLLDEGRTDGNRCRAMKKRVPDIWTLSLYQVYRGEQRLESLLFNTGFLTGKIAEVENSCSADGTAFVDVNLLNERTGNGEHALHANAVGNLTDSKGLGGTTSSALQDNALEVLDTFFVTFFDFVMDSDGIASLEFGELFSLVISLPS